MSARIARRGVRMLQERRSKYRAVPTVVDGIRFASKAEARRFSELILLGKAGHIRNLELQPRFPLHAPPLVPFAPVEKVGTYVGDFRYEERWPDGTWRDVVEDVKGCITPIYRRSRRHMLAEYGIRVVEIRR